MSQSNVQKTLNYLSLGLMLIAINSHGNSFEFGSTIFWWVVQIFILLLLYKFWKITGKIQEYKVIRILIFYSIFSVFRGIIIAESYWDWKNLITNTMSLLIPLASLVAFSPINFQRLLNRYIYFSAPLFLVLQFYITEAEYGFYLAPFVFLLLFLPILPFKWKFICLSIAIFVITSDLTARSNVIKFVVPILFSFIYYIKSFTTIKSLNIIRWILLLGPILLIYLGSAGIFNVFIPTGNTNLELIEKKRDAQGQLREENLLGDTRSFIYIEVLQTAKKYDSWVLGRSPARGNISDHFGELDMNNRNERNANEVGILNYFTWMGLIGVILLFLVYYKASTLALFESNNFFAKILGLFVAFRWTYSWAEELNIFHIQYIYLWFMIGLCLSDKFRKMSDKEINNWVMNIF